MTISYHTHYITQVYTHSHEDYEIMLNLCGTYRFHYQAEDGGEPVFVVNPPETLVFIPKGLAHGVEVLEYPYQRYFILISAQQLNSLLKNPVLMSVFHCTAHTPSGKKALVPCILPLSGGANKETKDIFQKMYNVQAFSDVDQTCTELHAASLLGLLFCALFRDYRTRFIQPAETHNQFVLDLRTYIEENYSEPISFAELAKKYYVHPNYLTSCFRQQIGLSPRQYLTRVRLAMARKLLQSEKLPVQDVAFRVGYNDVNNFIRAFRERYDITPKQYQKKIAQEVHE